MAGGEEQRGEVAPVREPHACDDAAGVLAEAHVDEPYLRADDAADEFAGSSAPPAFVLAAPRPPAGLGRVDAPYPNIGLRDDARPGPGLDLEGVAVDDSRHARRHALIERRSTRRERKNEGDDSAQDGSGL